jgi:hypothetical protein
VALCYFLCYAHLDDPAAEADGAVTLAEFSDRPSETGRAFGAVGLIVRERDHAGRRRARPHSQASVALRGSGFSIGGSHGRLRFAVLLGVGKRLNDDGALCLMDIKEAVPAIAPCLGNLPQDDAVPRRHRRTASLAGTRSSAWREPPCCPGDPVFDRQYTSL